MTTAPYFLTVDEHVARNPIARAVARRKIELATRDFQIRLYNLTAGERVHADVQAASHVLAVAIRIAEQRGQSDAVMQTGMDRLVQLAQRGAVWQATDAEDLDLALHQALDIYCKATAKETQAAHAWVMSLDRSAEGVRA